MTVTASDIRNAAELLEGQTIRTPFVTAPMLSRTLGCELMLKLENLQHTSSVKARGAFMAMQALGAKERERGVITMSAGNQAQAVAYHAMNMGIPAVIVMPAQTPFAKVSRTRSFGAEVVLEGRNLNECEGLVSQLVEERGLSLIHPYDNELVMTGQGTAGLEAVGQLAEAGAKADAVVCCAGGGGLIAGVGMAFQAAHPGTEIWSAEPAGFDDHKRSLASGRRERNERLTGSICDAIITPTPGEMTWALNSTQLTGGAAITDEDALDAMAFAWRHLKIVVEPGGVAALAAVLTGQIPVEGRTVCVLVTGGNVDREIFSRALERL